MEYPQHLGREVHTSTSGIEIVNKFYHEPYSDVSRVVDILRGYIKDGKRVLPCRDQMIRNCYCTQARVTFAHEDAMASSPGLEGTDLDPVAEIKDRLERTPADPALGAAGAIIEAHYRPLVTAWKDKEEDDPAHGEDWTRFNPDPVDPKAFDWLEPTFIPGVRQVPWPPGLFIKIDGFGPLQENAAVPKEVASPVGVSMTDVTIRRTLVAEVPWQAITQCDHSVNITDLPGSPHNAAAGLPNFLPRTLRFEGADVQNMMDAGGNRWYDITYRFKWINQVTDRLVDKDGLISKGPITWNHVLMRPSWIHGLPTGWYEVFLGDNGRANSFVVPGFPKLGLQLTGGRLYNEANFIKLFEPDPVPEEP